MLKRRFGILFLFNLYLFISLTTPAAAHANLIESNPAPNTTLQTAPVALTMTFTEPLEASFARLKLFDSTGAPLTLGTPEVDPQTPNTLTVSVPSELPHGLYTVSWRVVSAADGHATTGAFTFAVGVRIQGGASDSSAAVVDVAASAVIVRWVNLLTFALLIGGLGFALWVSNALPAWWQVVGWVSVGLSGVLVLLNQASISADVPLLSSEVWAAVGQLLNGTAFAQAWLARVLIWIGVGLILWVFPPSRYRLNIALMMSVLLCIAHAQTSHAAARADHPEAVILDALHLLGASLWIGGLFTFTLTLWRGRKNSSAVTDASVLTVRFSTMARLCVAMLALTGLYSAILHVGSLDPLPVTTYGRALIVKNVLFGAMLVLAAVNLIFTSRALKRGMVAWVGILRGLIVMELLLAGGVILASAWMTSDMPAGEAYRIQQEAAQPVPQLTNFFEMHEIEGQMLHLDIVPARVGENSFTVTLFNADGTPLEDASRVSLKFTHLDNLVSESTLQATHIGFGAYQVIGSNLSVPGQWRVRLSIRQPGQFDVVTDFEVSVP